jgi:hypothetical protein
MLQVTDASSIKGFMQAQGTMFVHHQFEISVLPAAISLVQYMKISRG